MKPALLLPFKSGGKFRVNQDCEQCTDRALCKTHDAMKSKKAIDLTTLHMEAMQAAGYCLVECGGYGDCFYHSMLFIARLFRPSLAAIWKDPKNFRNLTCQTIYEGNNLPQMVLSHESSTSASMPFCEYLRMKGRGSQVLDQELLRAFAGRQKRSYTRGANGAYVENEIIAVVSQQAGIVITVADSSTEGLHVFSPDSQYLHCSHVHALASPFFLWCTGSHYQAFVKPSDCELLPSALTKRSYIYFHSLEARDFRLKVISSKDDAPVVSAEQGIIAPLSASHGHCLRARAAPKRIQQSRGPSLVPETGQEQAAVELQGRAACNRLASTPAASPGSAGDKSQKQHRSFRQQPMNPYPAPPTNSGGSTRLASPLAASQGLAGDKSPKQHSSSGPQPTNPNPAPPTNSGGSTRVASTLAASQGLAGDKSPKVLRSSGQQPVIEAQNVALASLGNSSLAAVCRRAPSNVVSQSIVACRPGFPTNRQRSLRSNRQSSDSSPLPTPPVPSKNKTSRHIRCAHAVRRTLCKVCNKAGQGSLCVHLKQKVHCRVCRTQRLKKDPGALKSFCRHGRQRSRCVKCHGSGICMHQREKYRCKECATSQILSA